MTETDGVPLMRETGLTSVASPTRVGFEAWTSLVLLCLVYVLNIMDRQLIAILAKPIQEDLHISDGQLGRLGGLYFAAFYCFISIPVGWLADRSNRSRVVAVACGLWSLATIGCGLSRSFPQLALSRMAVGVGEAGGVPPSYAIISDYFPTGRRGVAISLYNLGPPLGQALGVAIGASVAAAFSWRQAFFGIGIAGIFASIITAFCLKEPARGGVDLLPEPPTPRRIAPKAPFLPTLRYFITSPTLMLAAFASGATQIVTFGTTSFATLFLMREKGMTLHEVSIYYAALVGLCMSAGIILSGRLIDIFTRRFKSAYAILPAASLTVAAPLLLGFSLSPDWKTALIFLGGPMAFNAFYLSSSVTLVQEEVRADQRVLSGAFLLLIMNLIGLGVGPTYVGAMSDFFQKAHPHHGLQFAFFSLLPFYALAVILFLILAYVLRAQTPSTSPKRIMPSASN